MKVFSLVCSIVFLIAAFLAVWVGDLAFALGCFVASGLCRLDAQFEEFKEEKKK